MLTECFGQAFLQLPDSGVEPDGTLVGGEQVIPAPAAIAWSRAATPAKLDDRTRALVVVVARR